MPTKLDDSLNYLNGNYGTITINPAGIPTFTNITTKSETTGLSDFVKTWMTTKETESWDGEVEEDNDEEVGPLDYDRAVFNPPATIVLWKDGTKTVVKCGENDVYDPEKGLALCFMKKALGNTSRALNDILHAEIRQEK